MDVARFEQSPAGRLVKVRRPGDAEFWAFVPNPLPPELDLDLGLSRTLSAADRAVGELEGLAQNLPDPHIFVRPLIRGEAVVSSRIEGTQADLADLFAHEAGQLPLGSDQPSTPQDDVHEVLNYVRAMEYGLERRETFPVSGRFIRELHAILMEGVRGEHRTPGEFRTSPNWIGAPGCNLNEATYIPPPPGDELNSSLNEFERYLHTEPKYPPLVELALTHYQFEAIHPFVDGNGRVGRLLAALLLVHWGLLSEPLLYISEYFERNRDDYYDLLFAVRADGQERQHDRRREQVVGPGPSHKTKTPARADRGKRRARSPFSDPHPRGAPTETTGKGILASGPVRWGAFPLSQWPPPGQLPVTAAGPRRILTGFP